MSIEVDIVDGPLPAISSWRAGEGAGAVVHFEGVVRPLEQGRELFALDYEVYEPMTSRELRRLAERVRDEYAVKAIRIEHSHGRVPVGACALRLRVASAHRKAALRAMDVFIDRMKQTVPLWKVPIWAEPSRRQVEQTQRAGVSQR